VPPVSTPPETEKTAGTPQEYTRWQRLQLWLITWVGYLAIQLIGITLRFSVFMEDGGPPAFNTHPWILCFWHRAIFSSTYAFRNQGIGVITSESFDGEYIARVISKFGYTPIRGSSSRGGARALLYSRRLLEEARTVAATTDGPKGPVFVAKPGPVLLAQKTGIPIIAFHIAVEDAWTLNTWDRFVIPKPFTRALIWMSKRIEVPAELAPGELDCFHSELQAAQERVREFAEANVKRVGRSQQFPFARIS
jgi:lysophospholipid acyltransferase (LPLAT)-like uncharacterized protein